MTRRDFMVGGAALASMAGLRGADTAVDVGERVRGLIYGGAIGDALGGPIEFQAPEAVRRLPDPPKAWRDDERLDASAIAATAGRLRLRGYADLRPGTESYGQWNTRSLPGTITDDTRHKLPLLLALHRADAADRWPLGVADLARAYVDWPESPAVVGRTGYPALAADWLEEWRFAARWVLGSRDTAVALPPSRMWQGLPTCSGQMSLPPLAAVFAGEPERAYRAAHGLGFFDNGFGKDLNAAIVAGLAVALVTPTKGPGDQAAWDAVIGAMRRCDPYRFGAIRWTQRAVDRWLDFARRAVQGAAGRPARLFATLEKEFAANSKWEAQIPFVVTFASLEICGHHPLAALQLAMEWGHDTDSYAQLTGAFVGALHGPGIFPAAWREAVRDRLVADHGVDLDAECRFLMSLRAKARGRGLVLEG